MNLAIPIFNQKKETLLFYVACTYIGIEKIVTGHARLAGHACWDNDEITASEGLSELVIACIALQRPAGVLTMAE